MNIDDIVKNWKSIPIVAQLQETKELNDWHLEDNVLTHTELVVDKFINQYSDNLREDQFKIGLLACIFHDVGKFSTLVYVSKDNGDLRTMCPQHERISARMFIDWYLTEDKDCQLLTPDELYVVSLIIESHFLRQLSEERTKSVLYTLNHYNHLETFKSVLLADINGRIVSSEYSNKIKEISNNIMVLSC